ncbi:TolC family protein [candidate division KSB1 bacterium]|nr:TolC family protein [candidate division KSB1 bacterium]
MKIVIGQESEKLALSLKECEELAFKNNQKIQDAQLSLKVSEAKRIQASHAKILPKFQVRNIWGPSPIAEGELDPTGGYVISEDVTTSIPEDLRYFTQVDLDLIQPIYTFGKLSWLSIAAEFGVEAGQAGLEKSKEDVRLEVRRLYWALLLGKELLAVIEDTRKEMNQAESKIQELLDEGAEEVSQIDLFKLQIAQYEVNKRNRETLDKIELTKSALRITLGLSENTDYDIETEYLDPLETDLDSLSVYTATALQNRPELAQLRAGVGARRALVGISKSDYYPQFFLGGQIKYNFAKDRFDPKGHFIYNPTNFFRPGIVVGLNWNLNFVQTRDRIRLAQAEYTKLSQKEEPLISGIKLEVKKAYLEVTQAGTNFRESRKALRASDNWLRSESMAWDIGVGEVKDLIDAFKANGSMQAAHLENIFKYNVALAKLSKASGNDLYPN